MNLVDSSGWLEYLADGPNARFFAAPLEKTADLIVPTIAVTEVFKVVLRQKGEAEAVRTIALMQQGTIVPLDRGLAVLAARLGVAHRLPLAGSIILATARAVGATLWTQDEDFKGLEGVRYQSKK